jgi:hypothetical protein
MAFPGTYNFNYYAGDTFEFFVYPKNSTGEPFDDLSDYSALFVVGSERGASASVIDSLDTDSASATIVGGDRVSCTILPNGGRQLINPSYLYDVQIENTNVSSPSYGKIFTLLTGTISVTQDVAVTY